MTRLSMSLPLRQLARRGLCTDYRTRYQKEQRAKSNSIGRLIVLGITLGMIGTYIRIKVMAANPPPPKEAATKRPSKPKSSD
mmetsp:Transcript_16312/g.27298  ORF Transcript_16312/g.27298 Transcript_16312/m.27298 type:complete len:82 (-) Transcript_16312:3730-3975(-)